MYRLRMDSCLLLSAAALASCSERSTPTALSDRALAAATAVDRPYTWSLACSGDGMLYASWHWTQDGVWITSDYMVCPANGQSQLSNTGVRPANANGFTATVGQHSHTWTFDPAAAFTATLSGNQTSRGRGGWNPKEVGTLTVDS
jgi:hypothetical protein